MKLKLIPYFYLSYYAIFRYITLGKNIPISIFLYQEVYFNKGPDYGKL